MSEEIDPPMEGTKRLKESDWIVIVALWERGEVTLSELSDRFGVSKAALSQGLKRRKAVRGSKAHVATKKIQEKIESEKEKLVEDIYNFKKRFIGYGSYLSEMAIDIVRKASAPGGTGLANARGELLSIGEASKVVSKVRDDLYYLYDLYDQKDDMSQNYQFNVGVYSSEDVENLRKAQEFIDKYDEAREADPEEDYIDGIDGDPIDEDYEGI